MRKVFREILQTILLAIILFAGLQAMVQNFRIEGSSMAPTLQDGQYLLVNKLVHHRLDMGRLARYLPFIGAESGETVYLFHPPERGEVIVFNFPKEPSRNFVKRVIAIPGDAVELRDCGVYINDKLLEEPYIEAARERPAALSGDDTFGEGLNVLDPPRCNLDKRTMLTDEYFVLGDNRPSSNDSRSWGVLPVGNIVGRVWILYWPFSEMNLF